MTEVMEQKSIFTDQSYWMHVKDGDRRAFNLYKNHYSFYQYKDNRRNDPSNPNRYLIVGPGEKIVLLGRDLQALCCWRHGTDASNIGEKRVYCTCYRNESVYRASDLLKQAQEIAWLRWPGQELWTYIDPVKVLGEVPGYCFIRDGWHRRGFTKGGLIIMSKRAKS